MGILRMSTEQRVVTSKGFNYKGKKMVIHTHVTATVPATHRENRVEESPMPYAMVQATLPVTILLKNPSLGPATHLVFLCFN